MPTDNEFRVYWPLNRQYVSGFVLVRGGELYMRSAAGRCSIVGIVER